MKAKSKVFTSLKGSLQPSKNSFSVTFQTSRGGRLRVGRPTLPGPSNSPTQEAWRTKYASCVNAWNLLTPEQKKSWIQNASEKQLTGFNLYMSDCLRKPELQLFERYDIHLLKHWQVYGIWYWGQEFIVGKTGLNAQHRCSRIALKICRTGEPKTFIVSIRHQGETPPKPGPIISTGEITTDKIPLAPESTWTNIPVTPVTLHSDTCYVITAGYPAGDESNTVWLSMDDIYCEYPGPFCMYSWDYGQDQWGYYWDRQIHFREYGSMGS